MATIGGLCLKELAVDVLDGGLAATSTSFSELPSTIKPSVLQAPYSFYMAAAQACNRPGRPFCVKACSTSGGLATNPPCDKPIEDCSTPHRGFVIQGSRQRFLRHGATAKNYFFEPHPHKGLFDQNLQTCGFGSRWYVECLGVSGPQCKSITFYHTMLYRTVSYCIV